MDLAPDFDEFIGCLTVHGVEYLLVGAYALAVHGAPRFTGDLDVFVRPDVANAKRVLAAIAAFGFPAMDLSPADVVRADRMLQMGVEPVQIHVMSTISGVSWQDAWDSRITARLGSHEVPILGREALIRNKRAAGRPKDLADVDALRHGRSE